MAVTQRQDFTLRTLDGVFKAANRAKLDPTWTMDHNTVLFECPQCREDGTKNRASITMLAGGYPSANCNGCHDDVTPGIIGLLQIVGRPPGNVVAMRPEHNGHAEPPTHSLGTQTWRNFETTAGEDVPCIIKDLWPEGALGFIGAAPKAGKTWIGLDIAVSVTTGTPVFGSFTVPTPHPVLYVALEGHRAAIRTRIGCISRGHNRNPDSTDLDQLHLAYKPRGINLTDPGWAAALCDEALDLGVRLVIIDVLRRAATIKENDASSFMELVGLLNPISDQNVSLGMLHHFNKVNENTTLRTPAERMAGSGAMFGAFDVGLFITKSEDGARKLEIHTDIRDLAAPDKFIITLNGDGTGAYGGFTYRDTLRLTREDAPVTLKKGDPIQIRSFAITQGGTVTSRQIMDHFGISDTLLRQRRSDLDKIGMHYIDEGQKSRYEVPYAQTPKVANTPEVGEGLGLLGATPNPQTPKGRGIGGLGQEHAPKEAGATSGFAPDEVMLDQDDDSGYWDMMAKLNHDPEAKEPE